MSANGQEIDQDMILLNDQEGESAGDTPVLQGNRLTKVVDQHGHHEHLSNSEAIKKQVYRNARELTMLNQEMSNLKNYYENKLIQLFM